MLSAQAQSVVERQGVAYTDVEGDLVTSIVGGKDCVFTYYEPFPSVQSESHQRGHCCLCALEKVCREGRTRFMKPISCALYPIREKRFTGGFVGLNLHRWEVCEAAFRRGRELQLPVYRFLEGPLKRRFGEAWYAELEEVAQLI